MSQPGTSETRCGVQRWCAAHTQGCVAQTGVRQSPHGHEAFVAPEDHPPEMPRPVWPCGAGRGHAVGGQETPVPSRLSPQATAEPSRLSRDPQVDASRGTRGAEGGAGYRRLARVAGVRRVHTRCGTKMKPCTTEGINI